ncbi:hypothetical protein BGZ65_009340, partial [Modicella reniformis]
TGPLSGYSGVVGGASYPASGSYMDSNQQLQMLEQKYNSGAIPQSLFVSKDNIQQHQQQQQTRETLESVVEAMEINQAMPLATHTGTSASAVAISTTSSTSVPAGGLYGDRDASAWLTPSATYHSHQGHAPSEEDGSREFPFPVIRDRKELARAAGIRLDIPAPSPHQQQHQHQHQHHLGPQQHWIAGINGSHSGNATTADDMVGGSATSIDSSAIGHPDQSPLANSPLSAAHSSPATGTHPTATGMGGGKGSRDEDDNREDRDNVTHGGYNHHPHPHHHPGSSHYNSHADSTSGLVKTKSSNFEVFSVQTVPMSLYGQGLSSSESGFFPTDAATLSENNYLAKDQGVARRHILTRVQ